MKACDIPVKVNWRIAFRNYKNSWPDKEKKLFIWCKILKHRIIPCIKYPHALNFPPQQIIFQNKHVFCPMTLFRFPSYSLPTYLFLWLLEQFMKIDQSRSVLFGFWSKGKESKLIWFVFEHALLNQGCYLFAIVSNALVLYKWWTVVGALFDNRCEVECLFEWLEDLSVDVWGIEVYFELSNLAYLFRDLLLLYFERVWGKVRW